MYNWQLARNKIRTKATLCFLSFALPYKSPLLQNVCVFLGIHCNAWRLHIYSHARGIWLRYISVLTCGISPRNSAIILLGFLVNLSTACEIIHSFFSHEKFSMTLTSRLLFRGVVTAPPPFFTCRGINQIPLPRSPERFLGCFLIAYNVVSRCVGKHTSRKRTILSDH